MTMSRFRFFLLLHRSYEGIVFDRLSWCNFKTAGSDFLRLNVKLGERFVKGILLLLKFLFSGVEDFTGSGP